MTVHDYVQRRQLTEAAKLLIFSDKQSLRLPFNADMRVSSRSRQPLNPCINCLLRRTGTIKTLSFAVAISFVQKYIHPRTRKAKHPPS